MSNYTVKWLVFRVQSGKNYTGQKNIYTGSARGARNNYEVCPLKVLSTKKLIYARLGVSRTIYVNVDSPNLGIPYFNFLGGYQ